MRVPSPSIAPKKDPTTTPLRPDDVTLPLTVEASKHERLKRFWPRSDQIGFAALIVGVLAMLAAVLVVPEVREALNLDKEVEPAIPRYEKYVGQMEAGRDFVKFIYAHEGQLVYLNTSTSAQDFENSNDSPLSQSDFTIWTACETLEPGEKRSMFKCQGASFRILPPETPGVELLSYFGGYHLKGYCIITNVSRDATGPPHVTLQPLSPEEALLGR
jgi:hypothetical protein